MEKINYTDNLIIQNFRELSTNEIYNIGMSVEDFADLKNKTLQAIQYIPGFIWIYNDDSIVATEEVKNNLYGINR